MIRIKEQIKRTLLMRRRKVVQLRQWQDVFGGIMCQNRSRWWGKKERGAAG